LLSIPLTKRPNMLHYLHCLHQTEVPITVTARHPCQDLSLFSSCLATSLRMNIYSSPWGGGLWKNLGDFWQKPIEIFPEVASFSRPSDAGCENTYLCIKECIFIQLSGSCAVQVVQVVQHKKSLCFEHVSPSAWAIKNLTQVVKTAILALRADLSMRRQEFVQQLNAHVGAKCDHRASASVRILHPQKMRLAREQ